MKTQLIALTFCVTAATAQAESLYDAALYAQQRFCEQFFAQKCTVPAEMGKPPFANVAECKADAKENVEQTAQQTKTLKIKDYTKCKAKIDQENKDCMSMMLALNSPECGQ